MEKSRNPMASSVGNRQELVTASRIEEDGVRLALTPQGIIAQSNRVVPVQSAVAECAEHCEQPPSPRVDRNLSEQLLVTGNLIRENTESYFGADCLELPDFDFREEDGDCCVDLAIAEQPAAPRTDEPSPIRPTAAPPAQSPSSTLRLMEQMMDIECVEMLRRVMPNDTEYVGDSVVELREEDRDNVDPLPPHDYLEMEHVGHNVVPVQETLDVDLAVLFTYGIMVRYTVPRNADDII